MRIVKLAELRNRALAPLLGAAEEAPWTDLVFLNDVVYTAADVLRLLAWRSPPAAAPPPPLAGAAGVLGGGGGGGAVAADMACGLDLQVT